MLEHGRCQVESWIDRGRDATTGWLVPACNFGGNIEWQVGGARTREAGEQRFSEAYAQAKTTFREIEEQSPWGIGLVLGVVKRPLDESRRGWAHPYASVPISVALGETRLHFAPGWSRDRSQGRDVTTWGLAVERPVNERLTLVAEAFGENSRRPFLRAGGRYGLIKDTLELDLTWVARPGGDRAERFVSIGVFWQSRRLFN